MLVLHKHATQWSMNVLGGEQDKHIGCFSFPPLAQFAQ